MTEKLQMILQHFTGVRKSSGDNQYQANCPCPHHKKENNKHLAITQDSEGRIGVHCFAGCYVDEVLPEVGLKIRDLFPDQSPADREQYRANIAEKRKIDERSSLTHRFYVEICVIQQCLEARLFGGEMNINQRYEAWDREKNALRMIPKLWREYYR